MRPCRSLPPSSARFFPLILPPMRPNGPLLRSATGAQLQHNWAVRSGTEPAHLLRSRSGGRGHRRPVLAVRRLRRLAADPGEQILDSDPGLGSRIRILDSSSPAPPPGPISIALSNAIYKPLPRALLLVAIPPVSYSVLHSVFQSVFRPLQVGAVRASVARVVMLRANSQAQLMRSELLKRQHVRKDLDNRLAAARHASDVTRVA